jgi:hypothetical protein
VSDIDFGGARCCMSMPEVEQIKPIDEFISGDAAPPHVTAPAVVWTRARHRGVVYFLIGLLVVLGAGTSKSFIHFQFS